MISKEDLSIRRYSWLVCATAVLTVAFLIALATNIAPWLRGPKAWRWAYAIPGTLVRLWLPVALLALYTGAALWLHRQPLTPRRIWLAILLSTAMTPALQLALLYMDHPDVRAQLFYRTVSEQANGFFNVGAVVTDRYDFLHYYAERMLSWYPTHPQRHPPGLPILFSLARQLFDAHPGLTKVLNTIYRPYQCHNVPLMNLPDGAIASATLQMALPFAMSLVVWPLYQLGRRVYDQATAQRAVLLWPFIPGITLWAGYWTPFYALSTVAAFLLLHHGLSQRKLYSILLSGIVISLSLFLTFGNVAIAGFLGIYAMIWLAVAPSRPDWKWLSCAALLFLLGLASFWLWLWFRYGLSIFAVWREGMGRHFEMDRVGAFWIAYHLYDFFIAAAGVPLFAFWAARTGTALRGVWRSGRTGIDVLALAFFAGLLLLDLSGAARGEVARVWAFLLPLPLLIAVNRLPRRGPAFAALAALMVVQLLVVNVFLRYGKTDLTDPPPPPVEVSGVDLDTRLATWEDGMTLHTVSAPATAVANQPLTVQTVWSATRPIYRAHTIFVHMYDDQGNLVAQRDVMPLEGNWPTTCWRPGQAFADRYTLLVPSDSKPGTYQLRLGAYWLPTGERLPLGETQAELDSTVAIGSVQVKESEGH